MKQPVSSRDRAGPGIGQHRFVDIPARSGPYFWGDALARDIAQDVYELAQTRFRLRAQIVGRIGCSVRSAAQMPVAISRIDRVTVSAHHHQRS